MAVKKTSTSNSGMDLILKLRDIRGTVRDERAKRLSREASGTRLTYHTGQEARINKRKR